MPGFLNMQTPKDLCRVVCYQCKEKGHFGRLCPKEPCPNCKEFGHGWKHCFVLHLSPSLFANLSQFPNVEDVTRADIRSAIVLNAGAKRVGNQLIDDTN